MGDDVSEVSEGRHNLELSVVKAELLDVFLRMALMYQDY